MDNWVKYSVVIPVYNSAPTLSLLIRGIIKVLGNKKHPYEIIIVDDHSNSATQQVVRSLAQKYTQLKTMRLDQNYGQFAATYIGVIQAKGSTIITIDDDLQYPPEEINSLLRFYNRQNYWLVYGHPMGQHVVGWAKIYRWLKRCAVYAINPRVLKYMKGGQFPSGFRAFNKTKLNEKLNLSPFYPFIDVYFYRCLKPEQVGYLTVQHKRRYFGRSGQPLSRKTNDGFQILSRLAESVWPIMLYCVAGILSMFIIWILKIPVAITILLLFFTGCFTIGAFILLAKYFGYHFGEQKNTFSLLFHDKAE